MSHDGGQPSSNTKPDDLARKADMINPPSFKSGVVKSCEHKFIYLGQRRIKDEYSKTSSMTKMVDVFYCEKCLEYQYKDY